MSNCSLRVDIRRAAITPAAKFGSVTASQCVGMLASPFRKSCLTYGLRFSRKQALHETRNFIARDEHVPHNFPQQPSSRIAKRRWNRNDRTPHAKDAGQPSHEFAIG